MDKYDEAIENEAQALKKNEQLKKKCKELELELNSTDNEHRRNEEVNKKDLYKVHMLFFY